MDLAPPAERLDNLIQRAQDAWYEPQSPDARQAVLAKLKEALAADAGITADDLTAKKGFYEGLLKQLHEGETRVYPDPLFMEFQLGLLRILDAAIQARRPSASPPPPGEGG